MIAPDTILDLIGSSGGPVHGPAITALFDAIAAEVEAGKDDRPVYIASITVPIVYHHAYHSGGPHVAHYVVLDLMRLCRVVDLDNADYAEALRFRDFEFEDALLFAACRKVGARYLVTRRKFGGAKRTPVFRRTAGEMLPLFK